MNRKLITLTFIYLTILTGILTAQSFQNFIDRVEKAPTEQRTAIVDSFLVSVGNFPFTENDTTTTFVYYGTTSSVTLAGDMNNWNPSAESLTKLSTTNLWFITKNYPPDSRLDYKFVVNGSNWILDPRNPYTCTGGFGPNSELRMPQYIPNPIVNYISNIPHGVISSEIQISSTILSGTRPIKIYTPPGYSTSTDSFPVILFHDGYDYLNLANIKNIIDNLTATGKITPLIAVFSPAGTNRNAEYAGSNIGSYSSFIVNELMKYVDDNYRTQKIPKFRATTGASNGGNISLYLALNYPNFFGNAIAQSSNVISSVSNGFSSKPKLDLKIYLDIGIYDIPQLIPLVRNLKPVLEEKGYPLFYRESNEGHSWGNWRAHIDTALQFIFPTEANSIKPEPPKPEGINLEQNYPNPFNPTTRLRFSLDKSDYIELSLIDMLGRKLETLRSGYCERGEHELLFIASNLPSGVYYYQLQTKYSLLTRQMVLLR